MKGAEVSVATQEHDKQRKRRTDLAGSRAEDLHEDIFWYRRHRPECRGGAMAARAGPEILGAMIETKIWGP